MCAEGARQLKNSASDIYEGGGVVNPPLRTFLEWLDIFSFDKMRPHSYPQSGRFPYLEESQSSNNTFLQVNIPLKRFLWQIIKVSI